MQQFGSMRVSFNSYNNKQKVIYYTFKVEEQDTNIQWLIETRYSQLRALHLRLKKELQGQLPNFPRKKYFGNTKETFINHRQKQLINYLNLILNNVYKDKIEILLQFLNDQTKDNSDKNNLLKDDLQNKKKEELFYKEKEEIISQLIDCAYNIQAPDHLEIAYKQKHYQSINLKKIRIPSYINVTPNIQNNITASQLTNTSFIHENSKFISMMNFSMQNIQKKFHELANQAQTGQQLTVVFRFQSAQ